jgi:hypothetical protein
LYLISSDLGEVYIGRVGGHFSCRHEKCRKPAPPLCAPLSNPNTSVLDWRNAEVWAAARELGLPEERIVNLAEI